MRLVCGCEKFLLALAYLIFLVLTGSCLTISPYIVYNQQLIIIYSANSVGPPCTLDPMCCLSHQNLGQLNDPSVWSFRMDSEYHCQTFAKLSIWHDTFHLSKYIVMSQQPRHLHLLHNLSQAFCLHSGFRQGLRNLENMVSISNYRALRLIAPRSWRQQIER